MDTKHIYGNVFDIQRFSVHDGPGIRTTVFLKGCPLSCHWCHNPESQSGYPELSYNESGCIHCGACISVCPYSCHSRDSNGCHVFSRAGCDSCMLCSQSCPAQALEVIGKTTSVYEVMNEIQKDLHFYRSSDGGVSLSGGEPLMQPDFISSILSSCKKLDIHTALETCGHISWKTIENVIRYVDLFLFDIKESDRERLKKFTGGDIDLIYENLCRLDNCGVEIVLRCPVIPGINDRKEHFEYIGTLADKLRNVSRIDIEPYNPLGQSKYIRLGRQLKYVNDVIPDREEINCWSDSIRRYTRRPVKLY